MQRGTRTKRPNPPRRKPWPSDGAPYVVMVGKREVVKYRPFGDDPCFACGQPGSTCQDCGQVICDRCNTNSNAPAGHRPAAHLEPAPVPVETEVDRLIRENREFERQIRGSIEDRLRKRNAELKAQLAKQQQAGA